MRNRITIPSIQPPMTIDNKNWFQIAINNYNLKELSCNDFGKLRYVGRGAFGNVYWTTCNSIQEEKVAVKEIYVTEENGENRIRMFLNESNFAPTNYPTLWNKQWLVALFQISYK
ncbi:5018_t:CDS:2 [Dentiscutata erythropus]|uniref:5018_t:CDS:1 n=1 Tax=Dentiscutata erythropus TaxID=1348616 RepID=A0A9N9DEQ7_9GLOM|nr:5018_t:CDS:2 [Dentiscutata erythropus]